MSESAVRAETWQVDLPTTVRMLRDRRIDRARWVVIAAWLVVLVAMPFVSERTSSWGHLKSLVASGAVSHVVANGELPKGSQGFSTVDLHWREHGLNYVARVVQVSGHLNEDGCLDGDGAGDCLDTPGTRLHVSPSELLRSLQPGLSITRHQQSTYDDNHLLGFAVPLPLAIAEALLGLAALIVLVAGPQPWRATRWAWFWVFTNPLGMAAFLLLSGPTPGLPAPRDLNRRLTGGWALVLRIVLSSATIAIAGISLPL